MENKDEGSLPGEVAGKILLLRGQRVLLDQDLAALYGVTTKALNQSVKRNRRRFPGDFLFALDNQELAILRSQTVTSRWLSRRHGGRRNMPLALTEHGAIMAATILNSARAVAMSVHVVRAFTRLRAMLTANTQLARKLDALEKSVAVLDADTKRQFRELRAVVFSLAGPPAREQ